MTKIIVLIKDIPDLNEIKVDPSSRRPLIELAKRRINDLDKRALEAAVRLKESSGAEVVTLSLGDEKTKTCILEALAIGADASYIVNWPHSKAQDPHLACQILSSAIQKIGSIDIILVKVEFTYKAIDGSSQNKSGTYQLSSSINDMGVPVWLAK